MQNPVVVNRRELQTNNQKILITGYAVGINSLKQEVKYIKISAKYLKKLLPQIDYTTKGVNFVF